ncbi:MAG: SDR family NAD(P)-dependent oxidoreductase [Candidatus Hermodarchaeota archaeon]
MKINKGKKYPAFLRYEHKENLTMSNKKQVAFITGATSGIGKAFAKKFASEGYDLIITGRRKQIIESVANKISKKYGVTVEVIIIELSDDDDLDKLVQKVKSTKNLDILVNNAGFATEKNFHEEDVNYPTLHGWSFLRVRPNLSLS